MRSLSVLALLAPVGAFRINAAEVQKTTVSCECSASSVVHGVETRHAGCDRHFGQQFGYVCYVTGGASCSGTSESHHHRGLFWRSCAAEHHIAEARGYLLEAMEGIDEDNIRNTMRIAEERHVDQATLDAAEQRIVVIHQMVAAREELLEAIDRLDYDRLQAALHEVEELELDEFLSEDVLTQAVERFSFLGRRRDAHNSLHHATAAFDMDDLLAKLEEARSYQVDSDVVRRGEDRVSALRRMRAESATELQAAVLTRDVERLTEAVLQVERLNSVGSSVLREGQDRLEHLLLMEHATQGLLQAIQGHHLRHLEAQLASATALDADPEVLSQGRQRVAHLAAMRDSVVALEAAIAGRDSHHLTEALAEAQRLEAADHHLETRAHTRLSMLQVIDQATAELQALFDSDDSSAVRHALTRAREVGVDPEIIEQGEVTKHRISRLKHDLRSTLLDLTENATHHDRHELRRVIDECSRLHAASHRRLDAAERRFASIQ